MNGTSWNWAHPGWCETDKEDFIHNYSNRRHDYCDEAQDYTIEERSV